jgi:linoleoyl-CoA desaturase
MSAEKKIIRFKNEPGDREFSKILRQRFDSYFKEKGISKHANGEMLLKTFISIFGWIGSYWLLMTVETHAIGFILLYMLHGFFMLFMAFNVAHDANHKGYSSKKWVNNILSYSFDVVGVNSYMWRRMHNDAHHSFVNVNGPDVAVKSSGLLRFSPGDPHRKIHRFQHIYASFLYMLGTLEWVIVKDFNWFFFKKDIGNQHEIKHPWYEYVSLFIFKAFYYTYTLVLPIMLLDHHWYIIVLAFVLMHFMIGFTIAAIFQSTHVVEGTTWPEPDQNGILEDNWAIHILKTTADYSWRNPVSNWFWGSLNVHAVHHIFPHICHVHYAKLTPILKETAEEYGITYRDFPTVLAAYTAHLKMLRRLGNPALEKTATVSATKQLNLN